MARAIDDRTGEVLDRPRLVDDTDMLTFEEVYEQARQRYLTAKDAVMIAKEQAKEAKDELGAALKQLADLRPGRRR